MFLLAVGSTRGFHISSVLAYSDVETRIVPINQRTYSSPPPPNMETIENVWRKWNNSTRNQFITILKYKLQITGNNLHVKVIVCCFTTYNVSSFARSTTGQMPALCRCIIWPLGIKLAKGKDSLFAPQFLYRYIELWMTPRGERSHLGLVNLTICIHKLWTKLFH
jgi:hypothetical protein